MQTFDFLQDTKVTIWCRQRFSIEAESREDAISKAERYTHEDVGTSQDIDPDVEWLFDTWETMDPKDNDNQATIELYQDDALRDILIGTNKPSDQ